MKRAMKRLMVAGVTCVLFAAVGAHAGVPEDSESARQALAAGKYNQVVELTKKICKHLKIDPGLIETAQFSDGEVKFKSIIIKFIVYINCIILQVYPQINESIRGQDVFIVQTCGRLT